MDFNLQEEEFSIKFNNSLTEKKHVNPFTMEELEKFKPHIVNFAKKCQNQNLFEIDIYGNHILTIYDHIHSENLIVIFKKDNDIYQKYNQQLLQQLQQLQKQQQQQQLTLTEEELKKLNEDVEALYDD